MFELKITGVVQGVGFRPFIYNLAKKSGIKGYVQNTGWGVKILCDDDNFPELIMKNLPPLAKVSDIAISNSMEKFSGKNFEIKKSESFSSYSPIPADLNLCEECLKELFDEKNFRYKYFFISCTNCGPRFSIVEEMPYDRDKTSLKDFEMCRICRSEYEDPGNRRYHAQTVACQSCGPEIKLYIDNKIFEGDPVKKARRLLSDGEVLAIKGVGGFHLACRADKESVNKLKQITGRYYKPFAIMAKDIKMVENLCLIDEKERDVLFSKERPIVLLKKIQKDDLSEVSELSSHGIMLPYSGLQYILFEELDFPLVMTSSNLPKFPITTKREEQFVRFVLDYNRDIANFLDDSIVKVVNNHSLLIRRSRGFAPNEILLKDSFVKKGNILALGSELKNVFCIKKDDKLIASQHIGNTFNLENFENFKQSVSKFLDFTKTEPEILLCDYNDEFNISVFAKDFAQKNSLPLILVQHHIAHGFGVALEHNLDDFLSIVCDGTGLGLDGRVWGGEVFHNDKRIGRLEYQSLIGSDIANKEPKRILAGILSEFLEENEIFNFLGDNSRIWLRLEKEKFNCIESSSAGRILDVVSVLLGFCDENYYEGRGAMLLESNSKECDMFFEPKISKGNDGLYVLDTTCLIKFIYENLEKIDKEKLAYFAQLYLAKGLYEIARMYDKDLPICFSGGCAYNSFMTKFMLDNGVFLNKDIPCGDGGIAIGQIGYYLWKY